MPGLAPTVGASQQRYMIATVGALHSLRLVGAPKVAPNACSTTAIERIKVATKDTAKMVKTLDLVECF